MLPGLPRRQVPHEGGAHDQALGQLGQYHRALGVEYDLITDADDARPATLSAQQDALLRLHRLPVLVVADDTDLLAQVLLHELGAVDQIELVVLFEDLDTGWVGERLEVDRGRIDLRGHVHELDDGTPLRQIDGPDILHEAEVLVVDGDLHLLGRSNLRRSHRRGQRSGE